MQRAFITGVSGETLTEEERRFVRDARPAGLILFARNCREAEQIRTLVADFKAAAGDDGMLVLIDQEGGRVQRLKPPLARRLPPARAFALMYAAAPEAAVRAAHAVSRLMASELTALGINTNCAPVLDVPCEGAHDIIGDRAYGTEPATIIALGRAVADGLLAGGVLPVVKHVPGHGRAGADSHHDLPVVAAAAAELERTDFVPFRALADLPAAMTAHVVFSAIDAGAPASVSKVVTQTIIREAIGFDGLLMSDDLSMKALSGTMRSRAEAVIRAGSDLALHCNGNLAEMREVVEGVPVLAGKALERLEQARAAMQAHGTLDVAEAEAALDLALAAGA
jgi:beta-N-acetylhexosaminidase